MAITAKDIRVPPAYAPGHQVAPALKHGTYSAFSEEVNASSDTTPQTLFNVPANVWIEDIVLSMGTGYNGNYVILGTTGDSDCFLSDTQVANNGTHSIKNGVNAALYRGGYLTTTKIHIRAGYDGSAGKFSARIIYSPYADENYTAK